MSSGQAVVRDGRKNKRPGTEEQRKKICEVGLDLLHQHGSRAVTISQICTEAGISRPTFYRCFSDIGALISELYRSSVNSHTESLILGRIVRDGWHTPDMGAAIELLADSIFEQSAVADLVFREANDPNSPACAIVNEAFDQILDVLESQLSNDPDQRPSRRYLKSILAASQWIVHDAIREGLTPMVKADAKRALWQLVENTLLPFIEN